MKQASYLSNRKAPQCGFTIVEIMLAITLSMILIAGVIQIYLSSKESFRVQNELARLQENQRIAVEFLQRDISKAGFVPYAGTPIPAASIVTINDGGGNNSDSISISYTWPTDCLGAATPNGVAVNTYSVDPATLQLMCLGNGGGVAQPIADGIENMQILVGEDAFNNSIRFRSADRYVNPATPVPPTRIVGVRIALLVSSANPIRTQSVVQNITLLDANLARNDRIRRQVVTTTIPLRNT